MLYLDVMRWTYPVRVPRPIADLFVPRLPFLGTLYSRLGVVSGARANVKRLLDAGELLMMFPEGTVGISKRLDERYQLKEWRVGHVELAIRQRAPIVPVAIIGAEEQWRQIAKLALHPFGAPFVPIPLLPFPLPVRYHIHYGPPIALHERYSRESADDPRVLEAAAAEVKAAVGALIEEGLKARQGVFA
jgi:1-acyl-sn-glycerol-3-phosphate acyltransferase